MTFEHDFKQYINAIENISMETELATRYLDQIVEILDVFIGLELSKAEKTSDEDITELKKLGNIVHCVDDEI